MRRPSLPSFFSLPLSHLPIFRLPLLLVPLLWLLALALHAPALAAASQESDLAPVAAHNAAVAPGDPAWPLTRRDSGPLVFAVSLDAQAAPPDQAAAQNSGGAFRIDFTLAAQAEDCACIGTSVRQSHYRSRGIEFAVRASRPVAAILYITTSNPDGRASQDRFFGTFHVGTQWKVLHLPFRHLAADPAWPAEARRAGLDPGDLVLRPDSVEAIRIGVDGRRTEPGAGTLWVGAVRFFR